MEKDTIESEQKSKSKSNSNLFLGIFFVILVIISILSVLYPDVGDKFDMGTWFSTKNYSEISFWAAVGFTVLACFVGALIPIPIPYAIPITLFSSAWIVTMDKADAWALIIVLVIFGTLGNTIGDFIDYLIGEGAEYVMSKDDPELQSRWSEIILNKPKSIPWIIMLFGLTPLPDSVLLVPLGFVDYGKKKVILYMFIGKFFMMLSYALIGVFTIEWLNNLLSGDSGSTGIILGLGSLFLIWIMMVIAIRYKPKSENKN